MQRVAQIPAASRPGRCGALSIATPFVGALLIGVLIWILYNSDSSFCLFLAIWLVPLTPIFGVGLAVTAWIRQEQHRQLPWIGLAINLVWIGLLIALIRWLIINGPHMMVTSPY